MSNLESKREQIYRQFLEESEEKFKTIFFDSPIGIMILDRMGQIVDVNDAAVDIFDVKKNIEEFRVSFNFFTYFSFKNNEKEEILNGKKIRKIIKMAIPVTNDENNAKIKIKYSDTIITALYSKKDNFLKGYLIQIQDITEQKKAENKIKKLNKKLYEEKRKFLEELNKAKIIQKNIISIKERKITDFDVSFYYSPMGKVGGDIYDVIEINKNKYGFFIGDVSGHGMPAALISSMVKILINKFAKSKKHPSDVLHEMNSELYDLIGEIDIFVTAFYLTLDIELGQVEFSCAGHPPAIFFEKSKQTAEKLDTDGTIIGAFKNVEYEYGIKKVNEGDRIILYTDGIIEAKNENRKIYSLDRLIQSVVKNSYLKSNIFIGKIVDDVYAFSGEGFLADDRAILNIEIIKSYNKNYKIVNVALLND